MKAILTTLIIVLTFTLSCNKKDTNQGGSIKLLFRPRNADKVMLIPSKKNINNMITIGDNPVKPSDFYLSILTGDNYIDSVKKRIDFTKSGTYIAAAYAVLDSSKGLSTSIPSLESELSKDFTKAGTQNDLPGVGGNIDTWQYRTTGIKSFVITSLNYAFGKAPGTNLNQYFSIYNFHPKQIINYQAKQLVWGYTDAIEITSIDQWLALKPMAQPLMGLKFNSALPEAPGQIKFIISMQNENDVILRDTSLVNFSGN